MLIAFVASAFAHALLAAILFSIASNSSSQTSEALQVGGSVVTLSETSRPVLRPTRAAPSRAAAPAAVPNAVRRAPVPQAARSNGAPQSRHELAKERPKASPNPPPRPIASPHPQASPLAAPVAVADQAIFAAAPTSAPSPAAAPVVRAAAKAAAPNPVPVKTAVPTAAPVRPAPRPTAAPSPPAPQPTAASTFAPVIADVTPRPAATPAQGTPRIVLPKPTPGAPTVGVPTPGPATHAAPRPDASGHERPAPHPASGHAPAIARIPPIGRPVEVPPVPTPSPAAVSSRRGPSPGTVNDLNARLRALIPHGPVVPNSHEYRGDLSAIGRDIRPTPPPDILARTKYVLAESGRRAGTEDSLTMYVTEVTGAGPFATCHGWLLRYPHVPHPVATSKWIVEAGATYLCSRKNLVPYVPATR